MTTFDAEYFRHQYVDYERQNPRRKLEFYRRCAEQTHTAELPKRVHDLGCAFGKFLRHLGPDWERYGSDISEYAIAEARRRDDQVHFAQAPASKNAFAGRFALVTAFDVLEHLDDLNEVRDIIYDQLLPSGSFLFVVPVYDGLSGPLIRLLDRDPTHIHKQPRQWWLDWAEARFRICDWLGIVRWYAPIGVYLHRPTRILRNHAPAILVHCCK